MTRYLAGGRLAADVMRVRRRTTSAREAEAAAAARRGAAEAAVRRSERVHRALLAALPGSAVIAFDADLGALVGSGESLGRLGHGLAAWPGRPLDDAVVPAVADRLRPLLAAAVAGTRDADEWATPDGRAVWHVEAVPLRTDDADLTSTPGEPAAFVVISDVTTRRRAESRRRATEDLLRRAFDDAPIGMAIVGLDSRIARANRALCELTGYEAGELARLDLRHLIHPDDLPADEDRRADLLAEREPRVRSEARLLSARGATIRVGVTTTLTRQPGGRPAQFLVCVDGDGARPRLASQLNHVGDHDALTGLLTRHGFDRELAAHAARIARHGAAGAVIVLDVDRLGQVNDACGVAVGDALLVATARALARRVRASDVLARVGGDEFAVLLPRASESEAVVVAEALVAAVRERAFVLLDGRPRRITASAGVALVGDTFGADGQAALIDADVARYDAKEAGRDRCSVSRPGDGPGPPQRARIGWADRIRTALDEERFALWAQPVLDLRTDQVAQHELLLRLTTRGGEVLGPGAFLAVAEQLGLAREIDRWVAGEAVRLLAEHARAGRPATFEINVSAASLDDGGLIDALARELGRFPEAEPSRLIVEVTEAVAVANVNRTRDFAERLTGLGCRFALDGFGGGLASFSYLKHVPFDLLKLGDDVVRGCVAGRTDQLVVEAVVRVARGLGKRTVGGFVEDHETLAFLRAQGVDLAQGFLVGRPAPLAPALGQIAT